MRLGQLQGQETQKEAEFPEVPLLVPSFSSEIVPG